MVFPADAPFLFRLMLLADGGNLHERKLRRPGAR